MLKIRFQTACTCISEAGRLNIFRALYALSVNLSENKSSMTNPKPGIPAYLNHIRIVLSRTSHPAKPPANERTASQ